MAAASALEMVAAGDPGASSVARLSTALGGCDELAVSNAIAALKDLSATTLLSAMNASPTLFSAINGCILLDSSPALTRWLFDLVGGADDPLSEFILQFVPVIAWVIIRRLNSSEPSPSAGVLLQAVYERQFGHGTLEERFQLDAVPDLSAGSIYHTPIDEQKLPAMLTVNRLRDHDLRSKIGSALSVDNAEPAETSAVGGYRFVRSALSKFVICMPKLPPAASLNFCILIIRLCSDDVGLYRSFTEQSWDAPHEKQTFFAQSFPMSELSQVLVRGLLQALVTPVCRPVVKAAITALHNKAQVDIEPAVLLSTTCLLERMRFDL